MVAKDPSPRLERVATLPCEMLSSRQHYSIKYPQGHAFQHRWDLYKSTNECASGIISEFLISKIGQYLMK